MGLLAGDWLVPMQDTHTTGLHALCKPCGAGSAGAGRTAMLSASLVSSEVNKGFQAVSTAGLENLLLQRSIPSPALGRKTCKNL